MTNNTMGCNGCDDSRAQLDMNGYCKSCRIEQALATERDAARKEFATQFAPKTTLSTHVLRREDFTPYALNLGVWQGLCEDHGVSTEATEIEITVTSAKEI